MVMEKCEVFPLSGLGRYRVILASGSPRRRELLSMLGVDFEVIPAPVDNEDYPPSLPAEEIAEYLAVKKSEACRFGSDALVITADTLVIAGDRVLGKPENAAHARETARHSQRQHPQGSDRSGCKYSARHEEFPSRYRSDIRAAHRSRDRLVHIVVPPV